MTTIAFRDGVMASDSRAYAGDSAHMGFKTKIFALEGRETQSLLGISSVEPGAGEALKAWIEGGSKKKDRPELNQMNFAALHVMPDGSAYFYINSFNPSGPVLDEFYAIGSGERYALGAMAMGARSKDAVGIAIRYDPWTSGEVNVLHMPVQQVKPDPYDMI